MSRHLKGFVLATVLLLVSACANQLNRVTSDRYADACSEAEKDDQLVMAEQACYRALANVEWGNLGPELKSQRLYNFARIERRLGKFAEAEQLLRQSISIEETLSGPDSVKVGRRLVELSVDLAGQEKWIEGADQLARVLPIADQFSGQERSYTKVVLTKYSEELGRAGVSELSAQFAARASEL
jgi:hypothetical protein